MHTSITNIMSLKYQISSPLEAGTSLLDAHQLPSVVASALEYAARRLARKELHIKVAVVRHEFQLSTPMTPGVNSMVNSPACSVFSSPLASPVPSLVSSASTPARSTFVISPVQAFKQLVRSNTTAVVSAAEKPTSNATMQMELSRSKTVSPTFSPYRADEGWPLSSFPPTMVPMTPATPATPASIDSVTTSDTSYATSVSGDFRPPTTYGYRLVHGTSADLKTQRILQQALERARKKFHLRSASSHSPEPYYSKELTRPRPNRHHLLSGPHPPSACGITNEVVLRAFAQNEVVFSSNTLTLCALDHLFSFKSALMAYARTQSPCKLEDAVDELRRLILTNSRQPLLKSRLSKHYGWMGAVSDSALSDVTRMYRRAYGGPDGDVGIENDLDADINVRRFVVTHGEVLLSDQRGSSWSKETDAEEAAESQFRYRHEDIPDLEPTTANEQASVASDNEPSVTEQPETEPEPKPSLEPEPEPEHEHDSHEPVQQELAKAELNVVRAVESEAAILAEMRRTTPKLKPAPSPKFPVLKLQTTFEKPLTPRKAIKTSPLRIVDEEQIEVKLEVEDADNKGTSNLNIVDDEDGDLTARPSAGQHSAFSTFWGGVHGNGASIDEVLSAVPGSAHPGFGDDHQKEGPMTPNGYEDISPVTRGEWSFFIKDGDGWGGAKTVAVETC
jgi:hypothetical protein